MELPLHIGFMIILLLSIKVLRAIESIRNALRHVKLWLLIAIVSILELSRLVRR